MLTPKYWIVENPEAKDVFIDTASKSLYNAQELFFKYHGKLVPEFWEGKYPITLFELRKVDISSEEDVVENV